ncbi:GntR family transcriptional regulator [Paenibacillus stellifer]|uniref:GntR family transcriptional regulator n=2 Tax=Paenibacillus stellifer TaxID=169760 RepID=A0A089LTI0_9BACL|nr:GntR family transcriptional regulator [Paenibacillus stellifer]
MNQQGCLEVRQMDDSRPIFLQISEKIENDILEMRLPEESQVPSTNQFAALYQINPATAAKGVNVLVDEGILYKKRGIGMFVAEGAREKLMEKRREHFYEQYVVALLQEAKKLGISVEQVTAMISKGAGDR